MSNELSCRVGIIGAGDIVRKVHLPVLTNMNGVCIEWIHDARQERAHALAKAHGLAPSNASGVADLPPCDVVLLAIPVDFRDEYLQHFAQAKTAVLCEKPFALSAAQHQEILGAFPVHSIGCGYMRRFFRTTSLLRWIVGSGMFGPLDSIRINEGNRSRGSGADHSFLDDPRTTRSRGVLTDLGSHSIDMALHIAAAEHHEILECRKEMDGAVDRKVTARVTLKKANCPDVDLRYCVSWLDRQDNRIVLKFERATVWAELAVNGSTYLGDESSTNRIMLTAAEEGASTYNQAFFLEWKSFLSGWRDARESLVSARSALPTTRLVQDLLDHAA